MAVRWISAVALMAAVVTGCGDDDGGLTAADLEAVDQAVDTLVASGFSRGSAQCYVEGMIATFGIDEISAIGGGVPVSPEVTDRAAELLDECGVFTDLTSTTVASGNTGATFGDYRDTALPRDQVDGPYDYGDDETLDALWDECAGGSGTACDELFFESPIGSVYEAFGNTCGNRPELEFDCSTLGN